MTAVRRYAVTCSAVGYENSKPKLFRCKVLRCESAPWLTLALRRVLSSSKDVFLVTIGMKPDDTGM